MIYHYSFEKFDIKLIDRGTSCILTFKEDLEFFYKQFSLKEYKLVFKNTYVHCALRYGRVAGDPDHLCNERG